MVSAVKECFVPRFDSKINPGRSSLRMVVWCWPSQLCMCNSDSFLDVSDQFPTTKRVGPGLERIGWEFVVILTAVRALCNFSKNSPRFSEATEEKTPFRLPNTRSYRAQLQNLEIARTKVNQPKQPLNKRTTVICFRNKCGTRNNRTTIVCSRSIDRFGDSKQRANQTTNVNKRPKKSTWTMKYSKACLTFCGQGIGRSSLAYLGTNKNNSH